MRTALPLDTRPINKTFTYNVTPGEYTLEFKGLVAPDMLATYYSCMSDNVSIKVGDTSGRVETTEENNQSGLFTNTLVIQVNSGNGDNISSCSDAPQSLTLKKLSAKGD